MKELEVGDVLYYEGARGLFQETIVFVSPSQAKSKHTRFDREPQYGKYRERGTGDRWGLETEEYKIKWETKEVRSEYTHLIEKTKYSTPSNPKYKIWYKGSEEYTTEQLYELFKKENK